MPKLLILDVDGVMTDGTKTYGPDGKVLSKNFCDLDFTAIKKFQKDGWIVVWLSADKTVNQPLAAERKIDFFYSRNEENGVIDKIYWLDIIAKMYAVEYKDMIYVGDDLFDIPVMRKLKENGGTSYCPANAAPQVDNYSRRLKKSGGHGAIMDLYYSYISLDDSPPSH